MNIPPPIDVFTKDLFP